MAIQEFPLVIRTGYAEQIDLLRAQAASDFPAGSTFF